VQASEIRQNKVTKQWVIYSPARRKRPRDFGKEKKGAPLAEHDEHCPFCPGNERMLTPVVAETTDQGGRWQVRVVPNKFPALTPGGGLQRSTRGIYLTMRGHGRHEVVIESPFHNRQIGTMSLPEVEGVIETCHGRYIDLMAEGENMMITIFRRRLTFPRRSAMCSGGSTGNWRIPTTTTLSIRPSDTGLESRSCTGTCKSGRDS
jgi:UDPglucose--hexose-1-phosphate uridylyltransferase